MMEAHDKLVSIAAFRATRQPVRLAEHIGRGGAGPRPLPSAQGIAHRERMLQFLRMASNERAERQGDAGAASVTLTG